MSVQSAEKEQVNAHLRALEEQIKASLNEIELKKSQLRELIEEKKAIVEEKDLKGEDLPGQSKKFTLRPLPKDAMLEEFLLQNRHLPDSRVAFFSPEESAKRSIEENEGVLSETLATFDCRAG